MGGFFTSREQIAARILQVEKNPKQQNNPSKAKTKCLQVLYGNRV